MSKLIFCVVGHVSCCLLSIQVTSANVPLLPYNSNTTYNDIFTANTVQENQLVHDTIDSSKIYIPTQTLVFQFEEKTQMIASNDFSIVREREQNITWNDRVFRQQDLFENNRLTYGINSSGTYNKESKDLNIQSWGPYFAWRFPIYTDRIYLENEVSYFKDSTLVEGYSVTVAIKLEATF